MQFDAKRYWPPEKETLLLKAGYHADPDQAAKAWKEWREIQTFDDAPLSQLRITATVGRHLNGVVTDDITKRLNGFRKFFWAAGAIRIAKATPFLKRLIATGVTPLLLKGAARVAADPSSLAERYFSDIDILIKPKDWMKTCQVVADSGYANIWNFSRQMLEKDLRNTHHSIPIQVADDMDVDLHQSSLLLNRQKGMDDGMWERSVDGKLGELTFRLPNRSDQLGIIFGHAFLYSQERSYAWVGDALACMQRSEFDWKLFEDIVAMRELFVPAAIGLRFLQQELATDVPAESLARIELAAREPFVSELDTYYSSPILEDADQAKLQQAEFKRIANVTRNAHTSSLVINTPWQDADEAGKNKYSIPVPEGVALRTETTLQIRYKINGLRKPIALAIRSFDYFYIEIRRWSRKPKWGLWWNLQSISIQVPGALIATREIPRLKLLVWPGENARPNDNDVKIGVTVSYHWVSSNAAETDREV